jgi:hypothetical protein
MTTADMRDRYCLHKALIFWLRVLIALQMTNTVEDLILLFIYNDTHMGAVKHECRIRFIYARKTAFLVLFVNYFA